MILAGDVGGTKCNLALFSEKDGKLEVVFRQRFASKGFAQFDLIVSNPPYIPSAEIATLQPEVRDFDPPGALDGGTDGLEFYRLIASQAGIFLNPGGKIMLEFGDGQAEPVRKIFEIEKWIVEAVKEDYSHRARILVARS